MPVAKDILNDDDADHLQGVLLPILVMTSWTLITDDDDDNDTGWENVRTLDETNFRETLRDNCCVLVLFHAEWCGPCGMMKPAYAKVATSLRGHCVVVSDVDCTDANELTIACGVQRLPAVIFYWRGRQEVVYQGNRSEADLRVFVVDTSTDLHRRRQHHRRPKVRKTDHDTTIGPGPPPIPQKYFVIITLSAILSVPVLLSIRYRVFKILKNIGYDHRTVNHSKNFVDPTTGAQTQAIECSWGVLKTKNLRKMHGTSAEMLPRHLIEAWYRSINRQDNFFKFLSDVQKVYCQT